MRHGLQIQSIQEKQIISTIKKGGKERMEAVREGTNSEGLWKEGKWLKKDLLAAGIGKQCKHHFIPCQRSAEYTINKN